MSSSFFSNVFGQRTGPEEPSASVLAEWNKYSGDTARTLLNMLHPTIIRHEKANVALV